MIVKNACPRAIFSKGFDEGGDEDTLSAVAERFEAIRCS